jgi:hypothetical protein
MPLGTLGYCNADLLQAERDIRQYTKDYCSIINSRPKEKGLPPYIQPPKNSVRRQDGLGNPFPMPIPPESGSDNLVFSWEVPYGYDGIIMQLTNVWNGTGFIEGFGDITWRVKIDRRFIPTFDTILTTLGSLITPFDIMGQGIPLLSGQLVQYYVNFAVGSEARLNLGGMTICSTSGYIWPRERLDV